MSKECKRSVNSCKIPFRKWLFVTIMTTSKTYILIIAICLCTISWMIPFQESDRNNEPERIKIALRELGNQLLLSNRDSVSLVLPIRQIDPNTYQLSFEKDLTFLPDSLVSILDKNFEKGNISKNYIVEVLRCEDQEVSYSYEMNVSWDKTIVSCSGRQVPEACHKIEVTFIQEKEGLSSTTIVIIVLVLALLIIVGLRFRESATKKALSQKEDDCEVLGRFHFYPKQNKLIIKAEEIQLSKKECELLTIFVSRPNEVVTREELTKTVWEDHGVIVGRSLDTYISKLRKILKDDTSIKISNVHGVGYRLEVN